MNCILKIIQLDDILLAGQEHFLKIRRKQEVDEKMKSKFTKLLATALVLCLVLALLPAAAFAETHENYNGLGINVAFYDLDGNSDEYGSDGSVVITKGTEDKEYVITATPSEGFGLTTIKVKVNDTTVIETPHNSSTIFTQTFEAEGGNTVSVYARFLPMYNVNINLGIQNGTVEPNVYKAFEGGTVTLTVSPDTDYSVGSVSVNTTEGCLLYTSDAADE